MGVTEDRKIGFLRRENESINLVWRIEVDVPIEMLLAEVVEEVGDDGTCAQRRRIIA